MKVKLQLNPVVLIYSIVFIIAVLTWVIPGGKYNRVEKNGKTMVVADSFKYEQHKPQGLGAVLKAPVAGFVEAAEVAMFLFIIGGAFMIIQKTGAITCSIQRLGFTFAKKPYLKKLFIPVSMIIFSLGGSIIGMAEETFVFIPIFVPLALSLGYDTLVGAAIPFLGSQAGFAAAFMNPFTLGIAQGVAELPMYSGIGYRIVAWVIATTVMIILVMLYAAKIQKNPQKSSMYEEDSKKRHLLHLDENAQEKLTKKHKLVLFVFAAAIALLLFGVLKYGWYTHEIAGLFLGLGIVTGIVSRMKFGEMADNFIEGAKTMVGVAVVLGFARAILVVAQDGNILDTILHSLAGLISGAHPIISAEAMLAMQSIINFFVPSGSSQAALTMPIMTPLADVVGVARQWAVLAYQFGDGFGNIIIPTNVVLIGVIGLANIPYDKWFRWVVPIFICLFILAAVLLVPPYFIGWQ
jgi:uncharacterized ion transporter superfamily protein YfcC